MKRLFLTLILSLGVIFSFAANKENIKQLWNEANTFYSTHEYEKALESYLELESREGVSASLYYNIGNCYFKLGELAESIIYYNRALRLSPSNSDIEHNLSVANAQTISKISEIPEFFLTSWFKSFASILSSDGWAHISIIALFAMLAMLVVFLLSQKAIHRKLTFSIGLFTLLVTVVASVCSNYNMSELKREDQAIIMDNSIPVKSSPDRSGKDIFILNEGVKVNIVETLGEWNRIVISSGDSGWVEKSNMVII